MKKYVALKRGYDGQVVREVGEVFEFAGKPGAWMKAVDEKGAPAVEAEKPIEKPAFGSKGKFKGSDDGSVI